MWRVWLKTFCLIKGLISNYISRLFAGFLKQPWNQKGFSQAAPPHPFSWGCSQLFQVAWRLQRAASSGVISFSKVVLNWGLCISKKRSIKAYWFLTFKSWCCSWQGYKRQLAARVSYDFVNIKLVHRMKAKKVLILVVVKPCSVPKINFALNMFEKRKKDR